jgi:arylformamidase
MSDIVYEMFDISQTLRSGIAVWPGDTEFEARKRWDIDNGDTVTVGSVAMSVHTGTHADAPCHVYAGERDIATMDLRPYVGPALVVDLTDRIGANSEYQISADDVAERVPASTARVLFRTLTARDDAFTTSFAHFGEAAARELVARGVRLVGIDTPSIDHADSKDLTVHHVFVEAGVAVLENLVLAKVTPGEYELIALPLKLEGMDASPVRAILRRRTAEQ